MAESYRRPRQSRLGSGGFLALSLTPTGLHASRFTAPLVVNIPKDKRGDGGPSPFGRDASSSRKGFSANAKG